VHSPSRGDGSQSQARPRKHKAWCYEPMQALSEPMRVPPCYHRVAVAAMAVGKAWDKYWLLSHLLTRLFFPVASARPLTESPLRQSTRLGHNDASTRRWVRRQWPKANLVTHPGRHPARKSLHHAHLYPWCIESNTRLELPPGISGIQKPSVYRRSTRGVRLFFRML